VSKKITLRIEQHCKTQLTFRRENEPEPTIESPAKLFRVNRIHQVKGNPYWERRILREFGLLEVSLSYWIFWFIN